MGALYWLPCTICDRCVVRCTSGNDQKAGHQQGWLGRYMYVPEHMPTHGGLLRHLNILQYRFNSRQHPHTIVRKFMCRLSVVEIAELASRIRQRMLDKNYGEQSCPRTVRFTVAQTFPTYKMPMPLDSQHAQHKQSSEEGAVTLPPKVTKRRNSFNQRK